MSALLERLPCLGAPRARNARVEHSLSRGQVTVHRALPGHSAAQTVSLFALPVPPDHTVGLDTKRAVCVRSENTQASLGRKIHAQTALQGRT